MEGDFMDLVVQKKEWKNVTSPIPPYIDVSIFRFGIGWVRHGFSKFWALAPDHHGQGQVAPPELPPLEGNNA
jgi:hypothetical protein